MTANCKAQCQTCGRVHRWQGHPRDRRACDDPECDGILGRVAMTTPPGRGHLLASPRRGRHSE